MTRSGPPAVHLPCDVFVELVTDYLDASLSPAEVAAVDAHLEQCAGCVSVLEQFREVIRLSGRLREADVVAVDRHVRDQLVAAFAAWADDRGG